LKTRWIWTVVGVIVVLSFLAGWAVAQETLKYPSLPAAYSAPYMPTLGEWRALEFTAHENCSEFLTNRLIRRSCRAHLSPEGLKVIVDTRPQPTWDVYLGNGRFACSDRELRAAYEEAADGSSTSIMNYVRALFPGIDSNHVVIEFGIQGSLVGTWHNGRMTLEGED